MPRRVHKLQYVNGKPEWVLQEKKGTAWLAKWPLVSVAAGIHRDKVREYMEKDRLHGVPTEYTDEGDPIFTSANHRRKYLKLHQLYDKKAFY